MVIGDSNTQHLQFGEGKGKFGKWLPGKRMAAMHIEDIPEPHKIGPYRNIVLHTGVNNIKSRNSRSVQGLGNILEEKCKNISNAYPNSKVYLSLLLPTKLSSLNYKVKELNGIIWEISHSFKNVFVIEHTFDQLCKSDGCLKDNCGRLDKEAGIPLAKDTLHLGKRGLRLFAISIKSSIVGKFKHTGPGQQRVSAERDNHEGNQST